MLLALENAIAAAPACGFDMPRVTGWETRAAELAQAIRDNSSLPFRRELAVSRVFSPMG